MTKDGVVTNYTYNEINQLVQAGNTTYTYDANSNRTSMTKDGVVTTYSYNSLNQIIRAGDVNYTWDNAGNLVSQSSQGVTVATYTYDSRNRMISANVNSLQGTITESYTYDYLGNRTSKTSGGVTTVFTTDLSTGYSQVLKATKGTDTVYYTRGFELISRREGTNASYYLYDGGLSVRALTDESGVVTDTLVFDAFGNETGRTGTTDNSYGFQGEEKDSTGLYYLRTRYMDPSTGTFTSMDTYSGSLSDPMSLHKYLFANSNPVMYSDPSGHYTLAEEMEVCKIMCVLSAISYSYLWAIDCEVTDPNCNNHSMGDYLIGLLVSVCFGMLMGMFMFTIAIGIILGFAMILYGITGFQKAYYDYQAGHEAYGILEAALSLISIINGIGITYTGFSSVSSGKSTLSIRGVWKNSRGETVYPPHEGSIPGTEQEIALQPGDTIGRYGGYGETSHYVTDTSSSASELALPPGTDPNNYQIYMVTREIPNVIRSQVADWAGSNGGGTQYNLPMPIKYYIKNGYLIPV